MKALAFTLSVLLATALVMGGSLLIVSIQGDGLSGLTGLALASLTVFIYGPLMLGSLSAYWDVTASGASRRAFRLWFAVIVGLEVLSGIAIVVYGVLQDAPIWLPPLFLGGGIVLTVIALVVGPMIFRHDKRHRPVAEPWTPIPHDEVRRKIVIIAITFGVTLLVVATLIAVLVGVFDDGEPAAGIGSFALLAGSLAFIVAGLACILVTLGWNRRLRDVLGDDLGAARRLGRFVLRGKGEQPDGDGEALAAKYAAMVHLILAFQLGWIVLLYIGIGLQQLLNLDGANKPLSLWILVLLPVVLLVVIPLTLVRIRRARRYAREHAHLLQEPAAT